MFRILVFLVAVLFQGALAQEDCVPERPTRLRMNWNYILHWDRSTNCKDTHYLIYVHLDEDNLQYIFSTNDSHYDVNWLPACETFYILVSAFSNHQVSDDSRLQVQIPAPPSGTNLTIETFDVIEQEKGILLTWKVVDKYIHCAKSFRVVALDDYYSPIDYYVPYSVLHLDDIAPCAKYNFTVRAIYNQQLEGPIVLKIYEAPARRTGPPELVTVTTNSNSANMTFNMIAFAANRCPITAILVSGSFYSKTYQVADSPPRPSVTLLASPLQADSMYFLDVHVVNSGGTSQPLRVGIQTQAADN